MVQWLEGRRWIILAPDCTLVAKPSNAECPPCVAPSKISGLLRTGSRLEEGRKGEGGQTRSQTAAPAIS